MQPDFDAVCRGFGVPVQSVEPPELRRRRSSGRFEREGPAAVVLRASVAAPPADAMTDWASLLRPQLIDLGPYVPGASLDELKREYGLDEVAKLNWNEGLFGPLPGVLDAVAAELDETWAYPEHAYLELREGSPRDRRRARADPPGARDPDADPHAVPRRSSARATRSSCRNRPTASTRRPHARPGPSSSACPRRELRLDLERIADSARRSEARGSPGSATRTTRPAR